jgi:hypothetical protein
MEVLQVNTRYFYRGQLLELPWQKLLMRLLLDKASYLLGHCLALDTQRHQLLPALAQWLEERSL